MRNPSDDQIREILRSVKTIALLGASPKPERPSNGVMEFLLSKGYRVIPVNPGQVRKHIHGQRVVARLADIEEPVDMVDVFREPYSLPGIVDEVLAMKHRPKIFFGRSWVSCTKRLEIVPVKQVWSSSWTAVRPSNIPA